jgi:ribose-phosphate pyrophosphokinase
MKRVAMAESHIIDSDHYGASGIETMFFPGGEPHAKIPDGVAGNILLFLKLRTWEQTGLAACVIDALSRNSRVARLDVFIPYFPAARQDRSDGHAPLTIKLMAALLTRNRATTYVFDAHSHVLSESAPVHVFMPADLDIPVRPDVAGIIAPDKGAVARATAFRDRFYPSAALIQCSKMRNPTSGRLSGFQMKDLHRPGRYIIVDDICDGGGTFNLLADEFRKGRDPDLFQLELFVSHGIFSKGLDAIDPAIVHITTTDSWVSESQAGNGNGGNARLTVLPLAPLFKVIRGNPDA